MSGWSPTHWVPASGLDAWPTPDAASSPSGRLDPWLEVSVAQVWGDWAQVVCSNGWWGWVDGRVLVPRASTSPGPVPAAPTATPGTAAAGPATTDPAAPPGVPVTFAERARAGWVALVGAAAIALSSVLPWLSGRLTGDGPSADGFDVPLEFLLSYDSTTDLGVDLGVLLVVLGVAGAAAVMLTAQDAWRRGVGMAATLVSFVYVLQIQRLLDTAPAQGRPSLLSSVGFGVYVAVVGGVALAWAPAWPWRRAST